MATLQERIFKATMRTNITLRITSLLAPMKRMKKDKNLVREALY